MQALASYWVSTALGTPLNVVPGPVIGNLVSYNSELTWKPHKTHGLRPSSLDGETVDKGYHHKFPSFVSNSLFLSAQPLDILLYD